MNTLTQFKYEIYEIDSSGQLVHISRLNSLNIISPHTKLGKEIRSTSNTVVIIENGVITHCKPHNKCRLTKYTNTNIKCDITQQALIKVISLISTQ